MLGLRIRTGIHTGECERIGDNISGLGVVIGARVSASAGPQEILVSRTVKDLVVGSDSSAKSGSHPPQRYRLAVSGAGVEPTNAWVTCACRF